MNNFYLENKTEIKKVSIDIMILFLCLIIFFWKSLFIEKFIFFCSDFIYSFVFHSYTGSLLKQGQLPLWDPYVYGPYTAVGVPAIFYPFNMLMDFFISRTSEITSGFYFYFYFQIFHFFLGSFFMYILMKKIGLNRVSAIFSGLVFAYSGSFVGDIVHPSRLNTSIWLPITLLFLIEANQKGWIYSLISGAVLGISFLCGGLEIALFTCLILFLFSIYNSYISFKLKGSFKLYSKPLMNCFIVYLVAFGISAIQLVTTLEYAALSGRIHPDFDKLLSLGNVSPSYLIQFIIPNFFASKSQEFWWGGNFANVGPWEVNFYAGVITLIFVLLAVLSPLKKFSKFFFGILLLSIFLMLGKHTILSGWFFLLPGLGNARIPARYVFIANFSLAALSGLGADIFTKTISSLQMKYLNLITKLLLRILIAILLISVPIFCFLSFLFKTENNFQQLSLAVKAVLFFTLIFALGVTLLFFIMKSRTKFRNWLLYLLIILVIFDIFYFQATFNPVMKPTEPEKWAEKDQIIEFLKKDNDIYRVSEIDRWKALYHNIFTRGYGREGSFGLARRVEFEELIYKDINSQLFDLYNMKYVVNNEDSEYEFSDKFKKVEGIPNLYENTKVLPRAFIIHKYKVIKDNEQILNELKILNPREYIILEEESKFPPKTDQPQAEVKAQKTKETSYATIKRYSATEVEIDTVMNSDGFLFITDVWFPGWEVYIDGIKNKIHRANYAFRAVELNGGRHIVNFKYNPTSFKIGCGISLFTIVSLGMILIALRNSEKKYA